MGDDTPKLDIPEELIGNLEFDGIISKDEVLAVRKAIRDLIRNSGAKEQEALNALNSMGGTVKDASALIPLYMQAIDDHIRAAQEEKRRNPGAPVPTQEQMLDKIFTPKIEDDRVLDQAQEDLNDFRPKIHLAAKPKGGGHGVA